MKYIPVFPLQISQSMSMTDAYILILDAPEQGRQVPVLIGETEAQAIVMAVEQRQASRPLTHNLLNTILEEYMLILKQVTIDRFEEGIFYSTLVVSDGFTEKHIDSRTSDAVVLALMQHCDILIESKVLEETSMTPDVWSGAISHKGVMAEVTLKELEERLKECEMAEDYEQAAEIMKRINQMKKK